MHQKEVEKWREAVHGKLEELGTTDTNFSLENLKNNSEFSSVLIRATQIAARNHQEKKLEYLKNIILNTPGSLFNPDLKLTFLNFIDELSVGQIQLLFSLYNKIKETQHLNGYQELYEFLKDELEVDWSKDILKMNMLALETRGLIWISKSFNDFEEEMFSSSHMSFNDEEKKEFKFIIILEAGKGLLNYITR